MNLAPVLLYATMLSPTVVDQFRVEKIEELNADTSAPTTFDHCLRFTFAATMTPITSSGGDTYTRCVWVRGLSTSYLGKVYVPYPDTSTPGHTDGDCPFEPAEHVTSGGSSGWKHRHVTGTPGAGGTLPVHIIYAPGGNVATEAGQLQVQYSERRTQGGSHTDKWHRWTYDITKVLCNDASVDSRVANGKENIDYAGNTVDPNDFHEDPNAYPHNLNFGSSIYKGGLFAGNIEWESGDFSGRAHIQLWGAAPGSDDFLACATLVHMIAPKSPFGASDSIELAVYSYGSTDSPTESTATWANRWLSTDPASTPLNVTDSHRKVSFGSATPTKSYANWMLNAYAGSSAYSTLNTHRVAIVPNNLAENVVNWRYFASREFQASQSWTTSDFPFNDCRPRLWIMGQNAYTTGP
ncbi:MAG TPA: hypothetical protein PKA27_10250 [Fimbriimonadaceae bacterium]|nr:hypothetical protein [Fimbriimonadaceae bacterium]